MYLLWVWHRFNRVLLLRWRYSNRHVWCATYYRNEGDGIPRKEYFSDRYLGHKRSLGGFQTTTTGPWTVGNEIKTTKFPTLINIIICCDRRWNINIYIKAAIFNRYLCIFLVKLWLKKNNNNNKTKPMSRSCRVDRLDLHAAHTSNT